MESKCTQVVELRFDSCDLYRDKNAFEWKKNNKELVINGQYHEVIKIKIMKGYALVYVIADKAENELFKSYFGLNKTVNGNFTEIIKLLLNLTYLEPHFEFEPASHPTNAEIKTTYQLFAEDTFTLKMLKPPRIVFS